MYASLKKNQPEHALKKPTLLKTKMQYRTAIPSVMQCYKTKIVDGVTVTTDDRGGYPTWDMSGSTWHINYDGGGQTKRGKPLYHVTDEGTNPKQHYFFTLDGGEISDAVSGQARKKKFSQLPSKVQNFIRKNITQL